MVRLLSCVFAALFVVAGPDPSALAADGEAKDAREGGIVGTGIVGVITGLGSIRLNGQRVVFPDDLIVASDLGDRPAGDLVPGETVAVEAVLADGIWHAEHIRHYLPIVGPVGQTGDGWLTVLGSGVVVNADTDMSGFGGSAAPRTGQWIAVNGLWRGENVVATRIEKIDAQPDAIVVGTYRPDGPANGFLVGGTRVFGIDVQHAVPGELLTVRGTVDGRGLRARSVARGLFVGPVGKIIMEGYLSQPGPQGMYTIHGSGIVAFVGDRPMPVSSDRGIYCAAAIAGESIDQLTGLPEQRSIRNTLLDDLGADLASQCH